jgi:DNA-binding NarL/FixJ family response regulator
MVIPALQPISVARSTMLPQVQRAQDRNSTPIDGDAGSARILIAGNHPIFRDGLKRLLEGEPDLQVIGEAGDGASTMQLVRQLKPDLLLFDLAMPDAGLDVLRALAATSKLPRTIVLAASMETKQLLVALKLGVLGIVLKESTTRSLCESIRCVLDDRYALGPAQVGDLVHAMCGSPGGGWVRRNRFHLTRRQLEVVSAVALGESNKEVAQHFSISQETVKRHLSNIFDKLGVFSRLELAIFALNHGLIDDAGDAG